MALAKSFRIMCRDSAALTRIGQDVVARLSVLHVRAISYSEEREHGPAQYACIRQDMP